MLAIIPLFCAYLPLFCPSPPSPSSATPQPTWLDHINAPQAASPTPAVSTSNPTISASTSNLEDLPLAFLNTESPLPPSFPDADNNSPLSKRSVLHFASKPACKDSGSHNRKRGLIDRLSNKFQKQPAQPNCIPHPLFALRAARTTELNRREEFDRAIANAVDWMQAPVQQAVAAKLLGADGGAGSRETEMWRRRRWDEWFATKREELLELFGRAWAVYLV